MDLYRKRNPVADSWVAGYGTTAHTVETQAVSWQVTHSCSRKAAVTGNLLVLYNRLILA